MTPVVARVEDAVAEPLHACEAALLPADATAKRRREFAAGRCAARRALRLLGLPGDLPVTRDDRGRPTVGAAGVHVSISHAAGVAVAAAARRPLGIDLVAIEDHGPAFEREAFGADELAAWRATARVPDPVVAACLAFAAKEAVLKWQGVGLTVPLLALTVLPRDVRAAGGAFALGLDVVLEQDGRRTAERLDARFRLGARHVELLAASHEH